MKRSFAAALTFTLMAILLVGCTTTPAEETTPAEPESVSNEAVLMFTGLVNNEISYTESELQAMETVDVEDTDKDGDATTRTGVSLNILLEEVGVSNNAVSLVFVADDGSEEEVELTETLACVDCIVAFRNNGGFRMTMPGFSNSAQVKGVVEIRAQ